jgi:anti-sigma-K factor RskA
MAAHEQFADDLALYAIGSLPASEAGQLEQHLDQCGDCRRELEELRGDVALLALSASGPAPPTRSRERLLSAMKKEPRRQRMLIYHARPWWAVAPVVASLALAIFGLFLWRENRNLREQEAEMQQKQQSLVAELAQTQHDSEQAREMLYMFTSPEVQKVSLSTAKSTPQPVGKAMYLRNKGHLLFMASNLAPLSKSKTYQLWLIPMRGGAPMPAGTFMPDERGGAMVMNPPIPPGTEAKAFAVTVEQSPGSEKPSMPMVLMGTTT